MVVILRHLGQSSYPLSQHPLQLEEAEHDSALTSTVLFIELLFIHAQNQYECIWLQVQNPTSYVLDRWGFFSVRNCKSRTNSLPEMMGASYSMGKSRSVFSNSSRTSGCNMGRKVGSIPHTTHENKLHMY